jgi:uncharacterized protein YoxC
VKSTPVIIQTFSQFQRTRSELRNDLAGDLDAKRRHDLQDRQLSLQDLSLQFSMAQLTVAQEERDFLTEKESLVTSLHRIESQAEVQLAEAQVAHLNQKAALETEHNRQLRQRSAALPALISKHDFFEPDSDFNASPSKQTRPNRLTKTVDDPDRSDDDDHLMYSLRITGLETQKRELLTAIRDEKQDGELRIVDLTMLLEDEDNDREAELDALRRKMEKQEATAERTIKRLHADLEAVLQKRQRLMERQNARIEDLERKIEEMNGDFLQKLGETTQLAETLKTKLVNANMRKMQNLEMERKRGSRQQRLFRETCSLHQDVFDMQKRVNKARDQSGLLRRELSVSIGPRRTASLFM